jgi:hypothetical protein
LAGRSNKQGKDLADEVESKLLREEGRMWVFIRPRGGQDCYLLTGEIRGWTELCPIHRFDGMDQNLMHWSGPQWNNDIWKKNRAFLSREKIMNEGTNLSGAPLFHGGLPSRPPLIPNLR